LKRGWAWSPVRSSLFESIHKIFFPFPPYTSNSYPFLKSFKPFPLSSPLPPEYVFANLLDRPVPADSRRISSGPWAHFHWLRRKSEEAAVQTPNPNQARELRFPTVFHFLTGPVHKHDFPRYLFRFVDFYLVKTGGQYVSICPKFVPYKPLVEL